MCGIVGLVSSHPCDLQENVLTPLDRLSYRGYDSAGVVTSTGLMRKRLGKVSNLEKTFDQAIDVNCAIGHCRWATHGGISIENAHPHLNADETIYVVHNGILENFESLRYTLMEDGYDFVSETDTEVIAHYFDRGNKQGLSPEETIQNFFNDATGTYAVLVLFRNENRLYAFKKDSPLIIGEGGEFTYVSSDVYAFGHKTQKAWFFDDMEYAVVESTHFKFFDRYGNEILGKEPFTISCEEESSQGEYAHYMLKEIMEQPTVARRLIRSMKSDQAEHVQEFADKVSAAEKIIFVACGTSYHSSLVAASVLSRMGYNVHAVIASEFDTFYNVDDKTLIITVSQSGETMDVVTVLKKAKKLGAVIGAITNVPYSTIERLSDVSLHIVAGAEVAVASTKAFTNQILTLLSVAAHLDKNGLTQIIQSIPVGIEQTISLNSDKIQEISERMSTHEHAFFLGRGPSYPIAREMALKLKEISYIHAEGQPAAELKHGSIALIDAKIQTPVVILIPDNDAHMISSREEVQARGAWTITVSNTGGDLVVPSGQYIEFAVYSSVVGQLLSYYTAKSLGREIDQPRNLAKSVTVG